MGRRLFGPFHVKRSSIRIAPRCPRPTAMSPESRRRAARAGHRWAVPGALTDLGAAAVCHTVAVASLGQVIAGTSIRTVSRETVVELGVVAVPPAGSDLGHAGRLRRVRDRSRPSSGAITYRVVARGAVVVAWRGRRASMIRLAPIAVPVNRSPAPGRGESRPGLWLACLEHDGAGRLTGVSRETVRDGRSRRSRPWPVAASPGPAVAACRAEDGASALWAFHVKRSRTAGRG